MQHWITPLFDRTHRRRDDASLIPGRHSSSARRLDPKVGHSSIELSAAAMNVSLIPGRGFQRARRLCAGSRRSPSVCENRSTGRPRFDRTQRRRDERVLDFWSAFQVRPEAIVVTPLSHPRSNSTRPSISEDLQSQLSMVIGTLQRPFRATNVSLIPSPADTRIRLSHA
jgi:hypothetical protein